MRLPIAFALAFVFVFAESLFTNCAKGPQAFPVHKLYVDPPGIVHANQKVKFNISFTVPESAHIPSAKLEIASRCNGVKLPTRTETFSNHRLIPKMHHFSDSMIFPKGLWGKVDVFINVYNVSGTQLLCLRWSVFATNTNTNKTNWLISAMYS